MTLSKGNQVIYGHSSLVTLSQENQGTCGHSILVTLGIETQIMKPHSSLVTLSQEDQVTCVNTTLSILLFKRARNVWAHTAQETRWRVDTAPLRLLVKRTR
jgi:hypothetical protein